MNDMQTDSQQTEGAVAVRSGDLFDVLYHGCYNGPGHFLRSKKGHVCHSDQPWAYGLDAGLLVPSDKYYGCDSTPDGKWVEAHLNGWTAVSFWDRSGGDTRPGCNSTFLVHAEMTGTELLKLASQQWPEIFGRPGFPVAIPDTSNS